MISFSTFKHRIKDVTLKDITHIFLFVLAIPCAYVFKKRHPDLWLICEDAMEARDNGYWFFKYLRENQVQQEVYYAINRLSPDYAKVSSIGPVIPYGSFKHWIYYLAATKNISSQKGGKPNAAVCYLLEVGGILRNKRIYLKHGIIVNDMAWMHYEVTKLSLLLCGAKPEYEFVKRTYGYPPSHVQYTGLARFDNLHQNITDKKLILVMPTWRSWFFLKSKNQDGHTPDVACSQYVHAWQDFLNSSKLYQLLEKHDLRLLFYPHRNMQRYIELFQSHHPRILLAKREDYDVQNLLLQSAILITDYSSVFFDMLYMKKPVLFYQFDADEFRRRQYAPGYFDYADNPFTKRCTSCEGILQNLEEYACRNFEVSREFLNAHSAYFPLYDTQNCKRILNAIRKMD